MTKIKRDNMIGTSNDPSQKKKKRMKKKKDLEKMRKNVLAAKQQTKRNNQKQKKITKSSFEKTLNNFAQIRQNNEDQTQGYPDKKVKKKTICARLLPEQSIGIFKNGAMGKEVRRTSKLPFNHQDEARLRGDIFKLLNGGDVPSPDKSVTGNEEIKDDDSSGIKSVFSSSQNHDIKDATNYENIKDRSRNMNIEKNLKGQKNTETQNLQSDKTKRLFEVDNNGDDRNLDSIPVDPLHFSPRVSDSETKNSQTDGRKDESDNSESEHCWDPLAVKLYAELREKVDEHLYVDFSKLRVPDPLLEIKSRLANIYEKTHGKRPESSNNNDTYPFPRASTSRTEWSAEAQASTGTSDNNRSTPLNPFTKSKSTPHDYETVEARIINAMASLPSKPVYPLPDPFFGATSPQSPVSLSPISSTTLILSNQGNVDKTTTDQDINGSPTSRPEDGLITENTGHFMDSVTSLSSLPLGWDANAENERNLIRRNLKHVPAILRRTQPREILFDVEHLTNVKAQVPPSQAYPKVTQLQEQVQAPAPAAQATRVTQTQVHPLQTEVCRKINRTNNHEFFPPLLPNDKSHYPGLLDKELHNYPTPSVVISLLDKNKNKTRDSKSKGNFINPPLHTKFINPNPYGEVMKATKNVWNNQFPPLLPSLPPHLTRTADAGTNSHYPFTFSSNDFLKSRTDILKDDYVRFNGEKRELKTTTGIPGTKPPAIAVEQRNLNSQKQFTYTSRDLNPQLNAETFKLFPKHNQHVGYQLQPLQKHQPEHLHKSMMYEPIPLRQNNEVINFNHKSMFGRNDDFFVKNENLPWKSTDTRNLCYENKGREIDNLKLSFRSMNNNNLSGDNPKLDNGISDTVLENLKILSFEEDQYPGKLCIDHNYNYNDNDHRRRHYNEPQTQPHYYQGYCQQDQMGKHFKNFSQPTKYLAVMNEHQSHPRIPQRVPIYFNEPASINNQPTNTDTNVGYYDADLQQYRAPQEMQRKQIKSGIPVAVFAAKDRNQNQFLKGNKYPEARHVFWDGIKEVAGKDNCNLGNDYGRFDEDHSQRPMRDANQMQFNGQMAGNQVREITLPNGQVGLFVPQTYVDSDNNNSNKNDVYLNRNHYPNYK